MYTSHWQSGWCAPGDLIKNLNNFELSLFLSVMIHTPSFKATLAKSTQYLDSHFLCVAASDGFIRLSQPACSCRPELQLVDSSQAKGWRKCVLSCSHTFQLPAEMSQLFFSQLIAVLNGSINISSLSIKLYVWTVSADQHHMVSLCFPSMLRTAEEGLLPNKWNHPRQVSLVIY